jgi:hypothetical protein
MNRWKLLVELIRAVRLVARIARDERVLSGP